MSEIVQRTEEWYEVRLGKATASRIADICTRTKTGWGAGRKNYAAELIVERLTGKPTEGFTNAAMQWGTDTEPMARAAYQFHMMKRVDLIGFVDHPRIAESGASPDGFVGDDGLVEFKCPTSATHIETLQGAPIPLKYELQMLWQMACTGRQWCDFASFDPRFPEPLQLFVKRVERDDARIAEIEETVAEFLAEVRTQVTALRGLYEAAEAA